MNLFVAQEEHRRRVEQARENAGRLAVANVRFETTGNGHVVLPDEQRFPVKFVERPSVAYGTTVAKLANETYWQYPRATGGVFRWVQDERGYYVGCYVFVTVDVPYQVDAEGAPVDAAYIAANPPTPVLVHDITIRGVAFKSLPSSITERVSG